MNTRMNANRLVMEDGDGLRKYIEAVTELKARTRAGASTNYYDEIVALHKGVAALAFGASMFGLPDDAAIPTISFATGPARGVDGGHRNPAFLPWHRAYLKFFERLLQDASGDDDVAIPYWDWTDRGPNGDFEPTSQLFSDEFMGPDSAGSAITSGHFSRQKFPVRWDLHLNYRRFDNSAASLGDGLVRNLRAFDDLPPVAEIDAALDLENYLDFQRVLEGTHLIENGSVRPRTEAEVARLHNFIHGWIGGSMAMMSSPNDPIFFMHHAFIDFVWARWQKRRKEEWEAATENAGQPYSYAIHYTPGAAPPHGHGLQDFMWPWDQGATRPARFDPADMRVPFGAAMFLTNAIDIDVYYQESPIRVVDVLDRQSMDFDYEGL